MKFSEDTQEGRKTKLAYIENRWKQLHELENKRAETVLNYLFVVSGGSSGATLAYIGNLVKDGNIIPTGSFWMLALFAISLVLVGFLKFHLAYKTVAIFKNWRNSVSSYYSDSMPWKEMIDSDEALSQKNNWIIHTLGWAAFTTILAGVLIGFFKLQEENYRVKTEKTNSEKSVLEAAGRETNRPPTPDDRRLVEKKDNDRRSSSNASAAAATQKKEIADSDQNKPIKPKSLSK